MANVVEIVLRGKDETKGLLASFGRLKAAFAGFTGGLSLAALTDNIIEAQDATAQLDSAFNATGKQAGLTRARLDELSSSMQKLTIYSDDLTKQGEAVLLTFTKVRGEAFERTVKVAADLAARMGGDLLSSIRQVGAALQDPERGLIALRRAGVSFSEEQRNLIKGLIDTGQVAKAQNVILSELEARFKGSAIAARGTLGGALKGLKNSFGDVFEGTTESTKGLVDAINDLSGALSDPQVKQGVDTLITGMAKLAELGVRLVGIFGNLAGGIKDAFSNKSVIESVKELLPVPGLSNPMTELARRLGRAAFGGRASSSPTRGPTGAARGRGRYTTEAPIEGDGGVAAIEEVLTTPRRIDVGAYQRMLDDMASGTQTSVGAQIESFRQLREEVKLLLSENRIDFAEAELRLNEGLEGIQLEIDIDQIRSLYKDVKANTTELGEFMKGVWQGVGNSIRQTLSDAIYDGKLSLRSLVDIGRRAAADLLAAFVTSGLKKFFTSLFSGNSSGGFWSSLAAAFGFSAGGGKSTRPRWVGEEGPELVVPGTGGMSVYNKRQMASMGGASIVFAPKNYFSIVEREDPQATKRDLIQYYEMRSSEQQQEFMRMLNRSGVEVN